MKQIFENKVILVTGGCGSIGSEIVGQLLQFNPKSIRVYDNNEEGHFNLQQKYDSNLIRPLIGDVRDKDRLKFAMKNVDVVFHAAALKHVPFCEYNPFEAVRTNVIGTENVIHAAIDAGVKRFVSISTDKATNPANTMGATKLLAEKIVTNAPVHNKDIKFCCVRFGNVLNSSGSVIPLFKNQINKGGPVTITSTDMVRFFMTISDAVGLVLKAAELTKGGETFVLKMNVVRITDLAEVLIEELAENPQEIETKIIGLRPGEKIHESLLTKEESAYLEETEDMYIIQNSSMNIYNKQPIVKRDDSLVYSTDSIDPLPKEELRAYLKKKSLC